MIRLLIGAVCLMLWTLPAFPVEPEVMWWLTTEDPAHRLAAQAPLAFNAEAQAPEGAVVIDEQTVYQTMLGLGASFEHSTCANLWRLAPDVRRDVLRRLVSPVDGIGMNIMRICMGTPDFTGEPWYTYNDLPPGETDEALAHFTIEKDRAYILPVLKEALDMNPDLLFFATPWSPPGWMKTSGDHIGGHLYPRYYGVYAEYFVRFIQAYAAEGIPIHAVTVQNEPGVNKRDDVRSWWYPSCQWSLVVDEDTWWPVPLEIMGHAERDFIRDHLGPAFTKHGLDTEIWCYDHNFNNLWYPRHILQDPEAARYVDGTAFHPYVGTPADMGAFLPEFPDKPVYLSEGSTFGIDGAVDIIAFLRNGASTYNAWVTVLDSNGEPNNGPFEASDTPVEIDADTLEVTYNLEYYVYGQFMKFIQRGAKRIGTSAPETAPAHIAFANPDGSIVVVAANPEPDTRPLRAVWQGHGLGAALPPMSVATFRWNGLGG